ncbi:hypothetical protein [Shouchella shacheensis]|uniref:hypothetical protein n=1 Tax=Shouchella shacheensis TaxID=1649580 RepID=UPI00073FB0C6|nr:hypothetical protein [Shouchella shacheensis]
MEIQQLERSISSVVQVCIRDEQGEEKAPWVNKKLKKLANCPDNTHLRIWFNDRTFFAVPLSLPVLQEEGKWSAYDRKTGLTYLVRREEDANE